MAPSRIKLPVHLSGVLLLVCSLTLLLTSILCVALKTASLAAYNEQTDDGSSTTIITLPGTQAIALYPLELTTTTPGLLTATASIGLIISLAVATASAWLIKRRKPLNLLRTERIALIVVLSANTILSTATFIYQFALAGQSTHFDPNYKSQTAYYDKGPFTLEAWTCEVPAYFSDFNKYRFDIQCTGERASRGLSVLLWIFGTAILGLLVWDMKSGHVIVRPKKEALQEEDDWT